jgi:ABC-type Fe3+/spermidine/putrescine transport system ATPase subunit
MDKGRIVQCGPGRELYANPATTFVAGFLGDPLLLDGDIVAVNGTRALHSWGVAVAVPRFVPLGKATAVMRPERLHLLPDDRAPHCYDNALAGRIVFSAFDGQGTFYQVKLDCGPTAAVHVPAARCTTTHDVGDTVLVAWNADDVPIVTQA